MVCHRYLRSRRLRRLKKCLAPGQQLLANGLACGEAGIGWVDGHDGDTGLKNLKSVYGWVRGPEVARAWAALGMTAALLAGTVPALAQPVAAGADILLQAREAFRKQDSARLGALRDTAINAQQPLAMWVHYWDLNTRLGTAQADEVDAFYKRWSGSYVEDRLRNDWLLELGRRRDWPTLAADYPRFRMNDDREVSCYAALADQQMGRDSKELRSTARAAWFAQRDADDGCLQLGVALYDAKILNENDIWRRARLAIDANKPRAARQAALLVSIKAASDVNDLVDKPIQFLAGNPPRTRTDRELLTLALMRLAQVDANMAATALTVRWEAALPPDLAAWAWSATAKQAAIKLLPEAAEYFQHAELLITKATLEMDWADDTLGWKARAALRANDGKPRWQQVVQAINAMGPQEQREPTWVYWKARALQALSRDSAQPESLATQSNEMLRSIAGQLSFYGMLASEELGLPILLPPTPAPLSDEERLAAARDPGLVRSLQLIDLGLRSEGVREWNFSLRGMDDRALQAAAQLACDRELWDRCINTSDRTRNEINLAQRFPTPFRREMQARARETGIDAAYVYGLIRQESRFVMDARSSVGASGLMQLMPATARWTAKKIGLRYSPEMITDRDVNLKIGTQYLRLILEDFEGSQTLSAAAYNAGPNRPRRWRDGPVLEPAIWAENIPFSETRDYVKKVLANATFYSALMANPKATKAPSLKARLGRSIGPRVGPAPAIDKELP